MLRCLALSSLTCVLLLSLPLPAAHAYFQDEPAPETVVEEVETIEAEAPAEAEAPPDPVAMIEELSNHVNWFWTCVAAFLVFFMQAGFALVEAGMTRSKNVVNIMMKNLMDFSIGSIAFWAIGFGLMFSATNGFCGTSEFFADPESQTAEPTNKMYTFLIFQTVFAATAATIVSGAMAERTKFVSYLIYSAVITAIIYPITGSWAWGSLWHGGGWLADRSFVDFAGSSVVHMVGGVAGLAGTLTLGPRIGKYTESGQPVAIPGHNMALATLGGLILWLGWFGFNPGSTTSMDGGNFARVAVVTNIAAAGGALAAMITAWGLFGKPDISMTINGALAGLVGITAGCYTMTIVGGLLVGAIAGVIVVFSVLAFDRVKIDDPVGAISVHAVCGAWGTIACGIPFFCLPGAEGDLMTQIIGVGSIAAFTFITTFILFNVIKFTIGLRVSEQEEIEGLDLLEHGMAGYN